MRSDLHKTWVVSKGWRSFLLFYLLTFLPLTAFSQFNTDRLVMIGRSALYYEDYVLSIQYFNQAIAAKPYLYEPWFFRAVAKYYLDDFAGAEADCSEAIERNPYIVNLYELRGLTRIQQKKYSEAVGDYTRALKYDPEGQNLWHNRILCRIHEKDYAQAHLELDTMLTRWSQYARGYAMRAEVYMLEKDTANAVTALDKSLELDPYDGGIWAERAIISLSRSEWKESEEYLTRPSTCCPSRPATTSTVPWPATTRTTCVARWPTTMRHSTSTPTTFSATTTADSCEHRLATTIVPSLTSTSC